jgi:Ni,Fe-hydrogenase I small subunit
MTGALVRYDRMKNRVVQSSQSCAGCAQYGFLAETAETGAESAETKTSSCEVLA